MNTRDEFDPTYEIKARAFTEGIFKKLEENPNLKILDLVTLELEKDDEFDVLEFADCVIKSTILKTMLEQEAREASMLNKECTFISTIDDWF